MKYTLPVIILIVTVGLVGIAWVQSGGLAKREMRSAGTPQEAVESLLSDIQARNWDEAYAQLANKNDIEKPELIRELNGSDGSLRTYSSLQSFSIWPVRASSDKAVVRARLTWSSAVGQLDEVRDLNVEHTANAWRVAWPKPNLPKVPPQVIPVNYLRWDVIGRGASDDWGVQNVDTPNVRITSMSAVERPDRVVIVGEIVNEDTVPAYVAINATLLKEDGSPLDQEGSFDMISHTLLPKQVSPYRIDFPGFHLKQVKSVRMDAKALLVSASADPVIAVTDQRMDKDPLGKNVLRGALVNQSGQTVNIAQVLAAYYDSNGKVIWVSGGYIDNALLPQIAVPFAVDVPDDVASRVQNYRVLVNYYSNNKSS
jgi:hypothetical protein